MIDTSFRHISLQERGNKISPHFVKDDGYEILEYENDNVIK